MKYRKNNKCKYYVLHWTSTNYSETSDLSNLLDEHIVYKEFIEKGDALIIELEDKKRITLFPDETLIFDEQYTVMSTKEFHDQYSLTNRDSFVNWKTPNKGYRSHIRFPKRDDEYIKTFGDWDSDPEFIMAINWATWCLDIKGEHCNYDNDIMRGIFNRFDSRITKRDRMIAASVVQFLGTNGGRYFLSTCGFKFNSEFAKIKYNTRYSK